MSKKFEQKMVQSKIVNVKSFPLMKYSLIQGVGAELIPTVKVGDKVQVGSVIAKPKEGFLGCNLHSSVSGEVVKIIKEELDKDMSGEVIYIQNDEQNTMKQPLKALENITKESVCARLEERGVIGMGGGGFPLSTKIETFLQKGDKTNKYIFINGASSDGLYSADLSVMRECYSKILRGIEILRQVTNVDRVVLVIRKGTRQYIEDLSNAIDGLTYAYIYELPNKICIGDERIIAKCVLGIDMAKEDALVDYGHMCTNVQTVCALVDAVDYGLPVTSRVISCAGGALKTPCNALVNIGSIYDDVITEIGGEKFPLKQYEELEESAKNSYMAYLSLRDEFNDDETDEDVKKDMVEARKKSNSDILEFLKAEKLYSGILLNSRICGGYLSGIKKDSFEFSITKTTLAINLLTKKEEKKRETLLKKFLKKTN